MFLGSELLQLNGLMEAKFLGQNSLFGWRGLLGVQIVLFVISSWVRMFSWRVSKLNFILDG